MPAKPTGAALLSSLAFASCLLFGARAVAAEGPCGLDQGGTAPLHRAVRNRCAAAVAALLDSGADARRRNKSGSTPMRLATLTTGRGGSGSPEAKAQQAEIVRLLEQHGAA